MEQEKSLSIGQAMRKARKSKKSHKKNLQKSRDTVKM